MWIYHNIPYKQANELDEGFIYKITHRDSGRFYIGKKSFWSRRRVKVAGRKNRRLVQKESDWKNYWSSCQELKADVEKYGEDAFDREILRFCPTKRDLTYWEVSYQFKYDVLHNESYNGNILGRFFRV